jgi:hypothetical protein
VYPIGQSDTLADGITVGVAVVGTQDGLDVGDLEGFVEGDALGFTLGEKLGTTEGREEGSKLGETDGFVEGQKVGLTLGQELGTTEGRLDGTKLGATDGANVGGAVTTLYTWHKYFFTLLLQLMSSHCPPLIPHIYVHEPVPSGCSAAQLLYT